MREGSPSSSQQNYLKKKKRKGKKRAMASCLSLFDSPHAPDLDAQSRCGNCSLELAGFLRAGCGRRRGSEGVEDSTLNSKFRPREGMPASRIVPDNERLELVQARGSTGDPKTVS